MIGKNLEKIKDLFQETTYLNILINFHLMFSFLKNIFINKL